MSAFNFRVLAQSGSARAGTFGTPHGAVSTPAFMPVGTQGTIKGLSVDEVKDVGAQMILGNAYHLYLRPGDELVRALGGLHAFSRWQGPMLTDSGGFQVFSLAKLRAVREEGVEFQSHIDGSRHHFTPERVIQIQRNLGADVIMQLDELIEGRSDLATSQGAMERSLRWLARCRVEFDRIERDGRAPISLVPPPPHDAPPLDTLQLIAPAQALFPIVQGGAHATLRRSSIAGILRTGDWQGIAVGGLSVGESKPDMHATLEVCDADLPTHLPRYLMGVGHPDDLIEGVRRGIDLFDCVAPTRMGRHGTAFTNDGQVQVGRSSAKTDRRPLVEDCDCICCTRYDRAYIRHLFSAKEMLGLRLVSLHNQAFLISLMRKAHAAIIDGTFETWSTAWLRRYHDGNNARRRPPAAAE